ncbi:MAG: type 1 glutamine amidotransferase, partial [Solirubrobacteraceae bacterium]
MLGAPDGSADEERPAHLLDERRLIGQAVKLGKPVLGVCFGAQLLAVALGGSLIKNGPLEVGMGSATLTEAGRSDPVLSTDREVVSVLHWHRHAYALPPGAVRLATSGQDTEQAFRFGDKVYGL